jgi:serine phosphatase RsbU (regulator of sigma subunit)/HAMP domain-containing protein
MKFWKRSLLARLVLSYLLLSLLTVGLVGSIAFVQAREALRVSLFERLNGVATLKANELNRWVNDQLRDVLFIANLSIIQIQGEILFRQPETAPAYQAAYTTLSTYLADVIADKPGLREIFILDMAGNVVVSTEPAHVGENRAAENYFMRGRELLFPASRFIQNVYISPETGRPAMTIVVPFFGQSGERLGVLAVHLYLERMNRIILDRTGLGQTGETYLVDQAHQFVSEARFRNQLFEFPQGIHTAGIDAALQKQDGTGLYLNYEGVPVIGVYRWLNERELALLAEMSETEAFAPARRLATNILLIGLLLAGLLGLGVYWLARQIARPILALTDTAAQVAAGDLSATTPVLTEDEVGSLARTFNQMTGQLQNLYAHLEELVANRTHRLEIVALLGERLNAILDSDLLLMEIVNQIKESFGYYHVHVYLLDEPGERLVMAAGAGQVGAEMKARGHAIPLMTPTSLVARAARTGEVVKEDNVREAADWLPNSLLPDTFSEIAVPIIIGGKVEGVLDAQEDRLAGFDAGDAGLLRSAANQVAVALNNARLFSHIQRANKQLKALNLRLQDELALARQIQQSLLPPPRPDWLDLDILCYSQPALEVGGDLYVYHEIDTNHEAQPRLRYVVAVGDVSGKGMPAALLMAVSLALFRSMVGHGLAPNELLARMDQVIAGYTQASYQNCALVYMEISRPLSRRLSDSGEGESVYTLQAGNAGCMIPIIKRINGQVEWVEIGGLPLGIGLGADVGYQDATLSLAKGDLIILSSDGVIEARSAANDLLGFDRFEQMVRSGPSSSAEAMLEHLKQEVFAFTNETELEDDMTLVVVRV